MSVFVGTLFSNPEFPDKRNNNNEGRCAYLTATTEKELIDFAWRALNVPSTWIHRDDVGPYFLIAAHKRKLAIKKGAYELRCKR